MRRDSLRRGGRRGSWLLRLLWWRCRRIGHLLSASRSRDEGNRNKGEQRLHLPSVYPLARCCKVLPAQKTRLLARNGATLDSSQISAPAKPRHRVALCATSSIEEAWQDAIRPWFKTSAHETWRDRKPSVVVVPLRSQAVFLRERLLAENISLAGVHFVTPPQLRETIAGDALARLPLREHLRLLLAIAAEQILDADAESQQLAAKSVVRTPDHLLRALDRFATAGWNFDEIGLPAFRPIIERFEEELRACGFELIGEFDRALASSAPTESPKIAHLLIGNFDGAHWPHWPLLRAAVASAEQALIMLKDPRDLSVGETSWIGSWEEAFGEAQPGAARAREKRDTLFSEEEMSGAALPRFTFLVGEDAGEQARAIALCCVRFLAQQDCTRLGVIFSRAGALPRLVASALAELDVPHNDSLAHPAPGLFEAADWRAWLELQRSPRVAAFLDFFNALSHRAELFPHLNPAILERKLRDAQAEILIDNLDVLRAACAASDDATTHAIAAALGSLHFLPARGTLSQFLEQTHAAFAQFGWKQHSIELASRTGNWTDRLAPEFSRALYLRWLAEVGSSFTAARAPVGDHPYARVQLLTMREAQDQAWSHLIFADANEGLWPPAPAGEFASEQEIAVFNERARHLNRRAVRRGRQGEGHTTIREGHTLYLGPIEHRQIAERHLAALFESATHEIAFAASLVQQGAPERHWNPSELFTRQFHSTNGVPLTQKAMLDLRSATRQWLEKSEPARWTDGSPDVQQTRIAYDARRDPASPAGKFDFAFETAPAMKATLSVSEFEKLLSCPAIVWMKLYLGIEAAEENADLWSTSSGQWVHDWLASIAAGAGKNFAPMPERWQIDKRVCAAAEAKRHQVLHLCAMAGKPMPDWWQSGWRNALFLARVLGEKIAGIESWPWLATEWKIRDALAISPAEGGSLSLRGRIDLLLARAQPAAGSLAAEELWLLDYKTGAKKSLAAGSEDVEKRRAALRKKLLDGSALQLALYALAARESGAGRTWLSLVSPLVRPVLPQLSADDIAVESDIFAELARMQQTGVFGMRGPLRSAFRYVADYPLAMLAVDPDTLETRWDLTHPALAREEEELW